MEPWSRGKSRAVLAGGELGATINLGSLAPKTSERPWGGCTHNGVVPLQRMDFGSDEWMSEAHSLHLLLELGAARGSAALCLRGGLESSSLGVSIAAAVTKALRGHGSRAAGTLARGAAQSGPSPLERLKSHASGGFEALTSLPKALSRCLGLGLGTVVISERLAAQIEDRLDAMHADGFKDLKQPLARPLGSRPPRRRT